MPTRGGALVLCPPGQKTIPAPRRYSPRRPIDPRRSPRARAIQTIAQLCGVRCTRTGGKPCDAQSAISAAKSQVVARLFTGLSMPEKPARRKSVAESRSGSVSEVTTIPPVGQESIGGVGIRASSAQRETLGTVAQRETLGTVDLASKCGNIRFPIGVKAVVDPWLRPPGLVGAVYSVCRVGKCRGDPAPPNFEHRLDEP